MPFLYNKLFVFDCKIFCLRQLVRFHPDRFAQNYLAFYDEYRLTIAAFHMNVNRCVIVTVEKESESVFREYGRHKKSRGAVCA